MKLPRDEWLNKIGMSKQINGQTPYLMVEIDFPNCRRDSKNQAPARCARRLATDNDNNTLNSQQQLYWQIQTGLRPA